MKHLYYGYGKGKTTATIGMAVRASGSGLQVLFVQFLKSDILGERNALKKIDNITLTPCPKEVKFTYNMTGEEFSQAKKYNTDLWNLVTSYEYISRYDVIIFDELFSLCDVNFLEYERVKEFLMSCTDEKEFIFTGHTVSDDIKMHFDYISFINKEKHPFDIGVPARKGIEF